MRRYLYALLCVGMVALSPILLKAQPIANFSASSTSGCSPIVVNFTDLSTGSPTSWSWDLGNGATSTIQNPSTTYVTAGTYTVRLTATNAGGSNTKTVTAYITVLASPSVSFTASDTIPSCPPQTITFTNTSTPGASGSTSYIWDFGDGTGSTGLSPSHTYASGGNYNVSLVVTNSNGCTKSLVKSSYIQMNLKPHSSFSVLPNTRCGAPDTIGFSNGSTGAVSYQWKFGDGGTSTTASPTHIYSSTGSYTVTLISTNSSGCTDTLVQAGIVNVGNLHSSFTISSSHCAGQGITFTNTSTGSPTSTTWLFGDGNSATTTNATHSYASSGTYTVKLISFSGTSCADTASASLTINPKPTANFSGDTQSSCRIPVTTNFTNLSTGGSTYTWTFGDGGSSTSTNPSHTYTAYAYYSVKLFVTNSFGCQDSMIKGNYIAVQPLNFGIEPVQTSSCPNTPVSFVNTTSVPLSSYSWDFGDGSTSTTAGLTPTHTYTSSGVFTVTFTYVASSGCTGTATTTVTVASKPTAAFTSTATPICPNNPVTFTNGSTGATHYTWVFGDGSTSNSTNATHIYTTSDTFTVSLIADNNGCPDTLTKPFLVKIYPPTAKFIDDYTCTNRLQITFTNTSKGGTSWNWNFGDGSTSTLRSPSHTYASYGTDTVTLTATDSTSGCTNYYKVPLILGPTNAQFTAHDTVCKGTSLTLTTATHNASNTWHFGDGRTRTTTNDTIHYTYPITDTAGIYNLKLVTADAHGCTDSTTQQIHLGGPNSGFTTSPLTSCPPLSVYFYDTLNRGTDAIAKRKWTWGDGTIDSANNATPNHTFTGSGSDTVSEVITDIYGCSSSAAHVYITLNRPHAGFASADTVVCPGHSVAFVNTGSGTGTLVNSWFFGDGGTSSSISPTHTYTTSGNYTVMLVLSNSFGCSDTFTRTAYIHVNSLNLHFNMSDSFTTCPPLNVNFTNTSSGISSYSWKFGNGGNSILTNPSTLYTYPGVYTVKLIGTAANGCMDSTTKSITVNGPRGTLSYSPTTACGSMTINFTSNDTNAASITWDMNNGYTSTSTISSTTATSTFSYTYTTAGTYVPIITLSDGAACRVSLLGNDTIKIDRLIADFKFTPDSFCTSGTVSFMDTVLSSVSPITSCSWSFGDGGTSTSHNPTHAYTSPGVYTVRFIMGTSIGCLDTITKNVTIFGKPAISAGPDQSLCNSSGSVSLSASGGTSYSWSPATGLSCTSCSNPLANPSSSTTYIVTGTDAHGCSNTDTININIHPAPHISAGTDKTICSGSTTTLTASGGASYSWSPATGLSCLSCASPTVSVTSTTTYILTGIDTNGCINNDTVLVNVNALPTVNAGADKSICSGSTTSLTATGASSYVWSPSTGLSCTACTTTTSSATSTTSYVVTGTDANGCVNKDTVIVKVNALPAVSAGPDKSACNGTSVTLNATGASTYSWSPATGLSCTSCASPTALPSVTTSYVVTGTDTNGCVKTDTVLVNVNTSPTVNAGPDQSICKGSSTTLTATGAATYNWSPATGLSCTACASPTATVNATTTYVVTGTSAAGCIGTDTVIITMKPLPVVNAGADKIICKGSSVSLSASGAASYVWSPASGLSCTACTSPTASVTTTSSFVVTGTDVSGCVNTDTIVIKVNPLPSVSAGADKTICNGGTVSLSASGAASYNWSPATGLSCTTCASPTASPSATTKYTVTGTDTNGCVNADTIIVTISSLPIVSAGPDQSICNGSTASLTASGAATYTWSPATGLSCTTCASPSATLSSTTTYIVTGTSAAGCIGKDTVTINVKPLPAVNAGPDQSTCTGGAVTLKASGAKTYSWTPAASLSCSSCDSTIANPATTTTYTVIGTGTNGCTDTDQVVLTVYPHPVIKTNNDTVLCNGSSIQLTASGASNYIWSPGSSLSCTTCFDPMASPVITTTYTVKGTDVHGCSDSDKVTITVFDKGAINVGADDTLCKGQSADLSASGGTDYLWTPATGLSNNTISNPIATPDTTTTYTVIIGQKSCFADTAFVTVFVNPIPTVSAGSDQTIFAGSSVQLFGNGTNIVSYEWTPAADLSCGTCPSPMATPKKTTTYTLQVTGTGGCKAQDDITINVKCESTQIFVPNTFTPNGDGLNDRFYPSGKGISAIKRFSVYNRWGEVVYQMDNMPLNDPSIGWDGSFKGMQAKPDVFVYIISATCETGEPLEIKGDVSLVR